MTNLCDVGGSSSTSCSATVTVEEFVECPPTTYSGGSFAWPVVGGGNYISQYFRYGHYGVDIAASYGTK